MTTSTDDLPGRLHATKHKHGDPNALYTVALTGSTLYRLQSFLEVHATRATDYFDTREAVLLAEHFRIQLEYQEPK